MQTDLAIGNQVHIPLHRSQKWQKHSARLPSRLQRDFKAPTLRARPQSLPKRAHPARQAHQPLGPGTASRPQSGNRERREGTRAESTPVSQRSQHPRGTPPNRPSGVHPHDNRLQGGGSPARRRSLRAGPSLLAQGQRLAHRLNHHSHLATAHPPAAVPGNRHPLSGLHLVGACPPCSRKGPLLPACRLKSPWRVKREATNSRFAVVRDSDKIPCNKTVVPSSQLPFTVSRGPQPGVGWPSPSAGVVSSRSAPCPPRPTPLGCFLAHVPHLTTRPTSRLAHR